MVLFLSISVILLPDPSVFHLFTAYSFLFESVLVVDQSFFYIIFVFGLHVCYDSRLHITYFPAFLSFHTQNFGRYPYIYNTDGVELHCLKVRMLHSCLKFFWCLASLSLLRSVTFSFHFHIINLTPCDSVPVPDPDPVIVLKVWFSHMFWIMLHGYY